MNAARPSAAVSWSGGKDSYAAMARASAEVNIVAMITMFDEEAARSRSHGLRPEVLDAQADRLGLRRITGRGSWASYDAAFSRALEEAVALGITHIVFGDIMFEEHRRWAERRCAPFGLVALEPLWGSSTEALFNDWVDSGAEALIVTARAGCLDPSWLGRPLRREMADAFRRLGVDPCGERGEYHTVVYDAPLFDAPMPLRLANRVLRSGCWAVDVRLDRDAASS